MKTSGICATKYCRRPRRTILRDGKRFQHGTICAKCHRAGVRERNPIRYAFDNLRDSARRRKISFAITLDEFREFSERTKYMERKGQEPDSLHIDRIDHHRGYSIGNIQVITASENGTKGNYERYVRPGLVAEYGEDEVRKHCDPRAHHNGAQSDAYKTYLRHRKARHD